MQLIMSLLLVCFLILGVFGLVAYGPAIDNVFSDIVRELGTPVP